MEGDNDEKHCKYKQLTDHAHTINTIFRGKMIENGIINKIVRFSPSDLGGISSANHIILNKLEKHTEFIVIRARQLFTVLEI